MNQGLSQEDNPIGTLREFVSRIEKRGKKELKARFSALLSKEFSEPVNSSAFLNRLGKIIDLCEASLDIIESDIRLSDELKADAKNAISSIANTLTITRLNEPWQGLSTHYETPAQRRLAWAEHAMSTPQSQEFREHESYLLLEDGNGSLLLEGDDDKWEPLPIERERPEFEEAIAAVEEVVKEVAGSNTSEH